MREFIDSKSPQLSYYLRSYWQQRLPHAELKGFVWDTLEEWTQVETQKTETYSAKERIFWHILQQTDYWDADELLSEDEVRTNLELCVQYLETDQSCPLDIVGIRP